MSRVADASGAAGDQRLEEQILRAEHVLLDYEIMVIDARDAITRDVDALREAVRQHDRATIALAELIQRRTTS